MAKSRAKLVAEFADDIESAGGEFPAGGGVTSYSNVASFSNGTSEGDFAFAQDTKALYVWDGSAWDRVYSGAQQSVEWETQLDANYTLITGSNSSVYTVSATDPDGFPINYNFSTVPASTNAANVAQGSDPNTNQFTVTPNNPGTFTLRVTADDGVSTIKTTSSILVTNLAVNLDTQGDAWANSTRVLLDAYGDGGTWTDSYDANTGTWTLTSTTKIFDGMIVQPRTMELGDEYLAVYYFSGYATDFNNRGGGTMYLYNVNNQNVESVGRLSNDTDSLGFSFTGIDTTYNAYQGSGCADWWFAVRVANGVSRWWYRQSSHTSDNWVKIGDGTVSGVTYIGASCNRREGSTPSVRMMNAYDYIDTLTMD